MSKLFNVLAFAWTCVVGLIIIGAIGLNILRIPHGLPVHSYAWQVFSKITAPFNPFNIGNFIITIALFSPALLFYWLADKAKKK